MLTNRFQLPRYRFWLVVWLVSLPLICVAQQAPRNVNVPSAQAVPTSTVSVSGLGHEAHILIDRWGVPHIYAASQNDVFFVQGYNAARDRLFQIDLWRRRGLGRLSAVFGSEFAEQDKASRLFLYRGDMQKEWLAYSRNAQSITEHFVAGINAYIDEVLAEPQKLPPEFKALAYQPEKWQASDVVRIRSHGLTRNLTSEVARSLMACKAALKADQIRSKLSPEWEPQVPAGLDPCLPDKLLDVFQLATQGVLIGSKLNMAGLDVDSSEMATVTQAASQQAEPLPEGSNAWVIAPSKSTTGRPILASDPHRRYSVPSLRYIAHLNAPKLNAIGAGEPALPGISIGHNGSVAFGLTIFGIDQEDLYVYETNPDNPQEYRYQGKWEKFSVLREMIPVKNSAAVASELRFTRHGPVIYDEPSKRRAFAVRSGWFEPGMAPYFGSINYMFATNFEKFKRAMLHWGAPSENQVYADAKGNIAWVPGGLAPIRPNWDGLLPVPGDGRYEWNGFLPGSALPSAYNPAQGWFVSANEMNLPSSYPFRERKLGFEWASKNRYNRLAEVLNAKGKISVRDTMQLQNDVVSIAARRAIALLKNLRPSDEKTIAAVAMLSNWDFELRADSAAAALFEVWWSRFLGELFKDVVLGKTTATLIGQPDSAALLDGLEQPQNVMSKDAFAKRDWVLSTSVKLAWIELEQRLGSDPARWQWGKLHHAFFIHPFYPAMGVANHKKLNIGPFPKNGGTGTPNVSSYDPNDFHQLAGPSFRLVVDVGAWDNSYAINTPGQSGDPDSPHYRDLVTMWLKGEYFPLLYSRKRVEAETVRRIVLQPR